MKKINIKILTVFCILLGFFIGVIITLNTQKSDLIILINTQEFASTGLTLKYCDKNLVVTNPVWVGAVDCEGSFEIYINETKLDAIYITSGMNYLIELSKDNNKITPQITHWYN
jgi:hypothetical protein